MQAPFWDSEAGSPAIASKHRGFEAKRQEYGVFPDPRRSQRPVVPQRFRIFGLTDVQTLVATSGVAFFLTVCLYHFGLFRHAKAVRVLTVAALGACGAFVGINSSRRFPIALGFGWALGILFGAAAGTFSYARYGFFGFSLANLRMYENVVPSENSAIVGDAGRVSFAAEAFLDQARAVGFAAEDGHTYCVAPVGSRVSRSAEVNFWAVGVDCCSLQGHFECDLEAQRSGSVHGIVMLDEHSDLVGSDRERFEDARRKAVATHTIATSGAPVFLRWATEQDFVGAPNMYHNKAALFVALVTLVYTTSVSALVWLLSSTLRGKLDLPPLVPKAAR